MGRRMEEAAAVLGFLKRRATNAAYRGRHRWLSGERWQREQTKALRSTRTHWVVLKARKRTRAAATPLKQPRVGGRATTIRQFFAADAASRRT
jgi:hypothetical protein